MSAKELNNNKNGSIVANEKEELKSAAASKVATAAESSADAAAAISPIADNKKTPVKRTPSKRMSFVERAQKESEELVRTMGGNLQMEGGRRTRSSMRATPTRASPPPTKKSRASPATGTPSKGRKGGRQLDLANKSPEHEESAKETPKKAVKTAAEKTPAKGRNKKKAQSVEKEKKANNSLAEEPEEVDGKDQIDAEPAIEKSAEENIKKDVQKEEEEHEDNEDNEADAVENNVDHKEEEASSEETPMEVVEGKITENSTEGENKDIAEATDSAADEAEAMEVDAPENIEDKANSTDEQNTVEEKDSEDKTVPEVATNDLEKPAEEKTEPTAEAAEDVPVANIETALATETTDSVKTNGDKPTIVIDDIPTSNNTSNSNGAQDEDEEVVEETNAESKTDNTTKDISGLPENATAAAIKVQNEQNEETKDAAINETTADGGA